MLIFVIFTFRPYVIWTYPTAMYKKFIAQKCYIFCGMIAKTSHEWKYLFICSFISLEKTFLRKWTRLHYWWSSSYFYLYPALTAPELWKLCGITCSDTKHLFLAHLSWKLKWAFLITCRPSYVCLFVCLSVLL